MNTTPFNLKNISVFMWVEVVFSGSANASLTFSDGTSTCVAGPAMIHGVAYINANGLTNNFDYTDKGCPDGLDPLNDGPHETDDCVLSQFCQDNTMRVPFLLPNGHSAQVLTNLVAYANTKADNVAPHETAVADISKTAYVVIRADDPSLQSYLVSPNGIDYTHAPEGHPDAVAFESTQLSAPVGSSMPVVLQLHDVKGASVVADHPVPVSLATSSATGAFSRTPGGPPVSSVEFVLGDTQQVLYYTDTTAGAPSLSATSDMLDSGSAQALVSQPSTVPSAPSIQAISLDGSTAKIYFSPSADAGGSSINSYDAQCTSSNGGIAGGASSASSPIAIPNLSLGHDYQCFVVAVNDFGSGAQSDPVSVVIPPGAQVLRFTSTPPASPTVGGTYTVTATGGDSGNPVKFGVDQASTSGGCTVSGSTVTFTGAGVCTITANQAGDSNYLDAPTAKQSLTVVWPWGGFLQPVDDAPTLNRTTAGSGIPVKFSLGGDRGLSILALGSPTSASMPCSGGAVDDVEQTQSAGASSLQYDSLSGAYTYIWKTDKSWKGSCRRLDLTFADHTVHSALFIFK